MRIFDVGNSAGAGFWCAAPDAATAIDIAFAAKHARKRENLDATDVTEKFRAFDPAHHEASSIEAVLTGTKTGRVVGKLPVYNALELFDALAKTGKPPARAQEKTIWVVES